MPRSLTRRVFVSFVLIGASPAPIAAAACRAPRVLFVCPAGTVKSAIARELLKRKAATEGVPVDVRARGLTLEDHVSPSLAARLKAEGINAAAEPPAALQAADIGWADVVVAFDGASQSSLLNAKQVWLTPSWLANYDVAKRDLNLRLDGLLAELRDVETCGP
jgi:predicted flap endonuclease-1-like 5' DNA nuclease